MKFNKLGFAGVVTILAVNLAHASKHCDGFEIKLKNNLSEAVLMPKAELIGADLQPRNLERIAPHSELVLTVYNVEKDKLQGEIDLRTISMPKHTVTLNFKLSNNLFQCDFDNKGIDADGVAVSQSHNSKHVIYTIG